MRFLRAVFRAEFFLDIEVSDSYRKKAANGMEVIGTRVADSKGRIARRRCAHEEGTQEGQEGPVAFQNLG